MRSNAEAVARDVLTADVCEYLLGRSSYHYEIVHDRVLAYGWRRYLGGHGPLRAATGLARALGRG